MTIQAQIAAVAQGLADLRAEIEQPKKEEEKPVEAEEKPEEETPVEEPKAPEAPVEDKPEEETPVEATEEETPVEEPEAPVEETVSEDAPVEEPVNEDADDEKDDEEVKPGVAQRAMRKRVNAMQKKLAAMERQLASMAKDPSFAAAAMQASDVPCADASESVAMSREQANAAYAKITDARERAAFRKAHAVELGL